MCHLTRIVLPAAAAAGRHGRSDVQQPACVLCSTLNTIFVLNCSCNGTTGQSRPKTLSTHLARTPSPIIEHLLLLLFPCPVSWCAHVWLLIKSESRRCSGHICLLSKAAPSFSEIDSRPPLQGSPFIFRAIHSGLVVAAPTDTLVLFFL